MHGRISSFIFNGMRFNKTKITYDDRKDRREKFQFDGIEYSQRETSKHEDCSGHEMEVFLVVAIK